MSLPMPLKVAWIGDLANYSLLNTNMVPIVNAHHPYSLCNGRFSKNLRWDLTEVAARDFVRKSACCSSDTTY